jgi:hypothetical protein
MDDRPKHKYERGKKSINCTSPKFKAFALQKISQTGRKYLQNISEMYLKYVKSSSNSIIEKLHVFKWAKHLDKCFIKEDILETIR